jgi:putative exporter of polyketide antibiotics
MGNSSPPLHGTDRDHPGASPKVDREGGELLRLPQWLRDLSPFTHFALVPAQSMAWGPFLAVLSLALAAGTVGVLAFQRRDLRC